MKGKFSVDNAGKRAVKIFIHGSEGDKRAARKEKRFIRHDLTAWLTIVAGGSALLGPFLLLSYLSLVGRTDIFPFAIQSGSVIGFLVFLAFFLILLVAFYTSFYSFVICLSTPLFRDLVRKKRGGQVSMLIVGAILALLWSYLAVYGKGVDIGTALIFVSAICLVVVLIAFVINMDEKKVEKEGVGVDFLFLVFGLVTWMVIGGLLVTLVFMAIINVKGGHPSVWECYGYTLVGLAPAILYYMFENKEKWLRIKFVTLGCLLVLAFLLVTAPKASAVLYAGMFRSIGASSDEVKLYMVRKDRYSDSLFEDGWVMSSSDNKTFSIQAKLLYGFGDKRVLCPPTAELQVGDVLNWKKFTKSCVFFAGDTVFEFRPQGTGQAEMEDN